MGRRSAPLNMRSVPAQANTHSTKLYRPFRVIRRVSIGHDTETGHFIRP